MTDLNLTEKVAGALCPSLWDGTYPEHLREGFRHLIRERATAALAVLSDPEVLAGMAGVLREHSESKGDASFLPSCRCGWVGSSRMAWVADLARHQATALADWIRGHR